MERRKNQDNVRYMVTAAAMAALVFVLTAFLHIPTAQGYIHIGDGIIYIAASILPLPYAMAASAIGAGLSDYISGFAVWVLPTVIIKTLTVLCFTSKKEKIINKRNIVALIIGFIICVGGYYLFAALIYGSFISPVADIPTNCIQSAASGALFVFLGLALDKTGVIKKTLKK